jgi:hypothetical protein
MRIGKECDRVQERLDKFNLVLCLINSGGLLDPRLLQEVGDLNKSDKVKIHDD